MNEDFASNAAPQARHGGGRLYVVAPLATGDAAEAWTAHDRQHPLRARLLSGEIDRAAYAELLAGLWTAYAGIEQRLLTFAPEGVLTLLPQSRASLILQDLATLRQPGVLKSVMKASPRPPTIFSTGAAIGAVFGLELIDLDAEVLLAALDSNPDLSHATAFFRTCSIQSPQRWPIAQKLALGARAFDSLAFAEGIRAVCDSIELATTARKPASRTRTSRKVQEQLVASCAA